LENDDIARGTARNERTPLMREIRLEGIEL